MYLPSASRQDDRGELLRLIGETPLHTLVTAGEQGLQASHLPLLLAADEGEQGTLYGHLARANPQWRELAAGAEAMLIFQGPDAYVSPSFYPSKAEHGKVVPTWNYVAVHAYGTPEFFEDADRLLDVVSRLTDLHERPRAEPWAVGDALAAFTAAQLRGIVGLRMPITRIEGKQKMSQNRNAEDRAGVMEGLSASGGRGDRAVVGLILAGENRE
jgi:transcriptional regulator